jgi:CHAD domain-containing protein
MVFHTFILVLIPEVYKNSRDMRKPVSHSNRIFSEFFRESSSNLLAQTELCRTSLTKKNIHNLRLSLKNLKAFCALLDSSQSRRPARNAFPESFDHFFSILGRLRDLQVAEKSLSRISSELKVAFRKPGARLGKLRKSQTGMVLEALIHFKPESEISRIGQKVTRLLARQKNPDSLGPLFAKFMLYTADDIASLTKLRHSERVIHAIRINIKTLYYMTEVFHNEPWLTKELSRFRTTLLDQVQIELGEWHDLVMFRELIAEMSPVRGKDRVKPWKIYILEEHIAKTQALRMKQINKVLKSDLFLPVQPSQGSPA